MHEAIVPTKHAMPDAPVVVSSLIGLSIEWRIPICGEAQCIRIGVAVLVEKWYSTIMKKDRITVAFDVGDTLVREGLPNHDVIELLRWFVRNGHDVVVWSGGGMGYACRWAAELSLGDVRIARKGSFIADIAVDDLPEGDGSHLGKVVVRV